MHSEECIHVTSNTLSNTLESLNVQISQLQISFFLFRKLVLKLSLSLKQTNNLQQAWKWTKCTRLPRISERHGDVLAETNILNKQSENDVPWQQQLLKSIDDRLNTHFFVVFCSCLVSRQSSYFQTSCSKLFGCTESPILWKLDFDICIFKDS